MKSGETHAVKHDLAQAKSDAHSDGVFVLPSTALSIIPKEDDLPTGEQVTKQIPQSLCGAKTPSTDLVSSEELKKRVELLVLPEYPKSYRCTGIVSVYIRIDVNGKVDCVAPKAGNPLAEVLAGRAALQWTFKPMKTDGKPVGAIGYLEFRCGSDGTVTY